MASPSKHSDSHQGIAGPLPRLIHFAEDVDTSGFFRALARYHDRKKYRMSFATLRPMAPQLKAFMEEQGVGTFSCNAASRMQYPVALLGLIRYLRANDAKILHAHLFEPSVIGLTAARLAGTPARILTRHYSNYHTRINRALHVELDRMCTVLSHHVIAVSNETAEHLQAVEGAPSSKVTAIHNGIDLARVRVSSPDARARVRSELGIDGVFTFLMAGRLHPEKGYEHLFAAIRMLKDQGVRSFLLLVAGRGPFLGHYEQLTASLGIAGHVRFLGFREDLPDLMAASDVLVLASVAESFGLVVAEALYLGLPVLATRVGGIPEIVTDGVDGFLVPPGDPEVLSQRMGSFVRGEWSLPGQGEAAAKKVSEQFGFELMMKRYEAIYELVLGGRG